MRAYICGVRLCMFACVCYTGPKTARGLLHGLGAQVVSIAGFSGNGQFEAWAVAGADQYDPQPLESSAVGAVLQASSTAVVVELASTSITVVDLHPVELS